MSAGTFMAEVRDVKPQLYLSRTFRARLDVVGPKVKAAFAALYEQLAKTGNQPSGPPFLVVHAPEDGYILVEAGAPCSSSPVAAEGFESAELAGGRVAVTVHRGPYERLAEVYPALAAWIANQGLTTAGPPREVYLTPPGEEPVTEVVWPVT